MFNFFLVGDIQVKIQWVKGIVYPFYSSEGANTFNKLENSFRSFGIWSILFHLKWEFYPLRMRDPLFFDSGKGFVNTIINIWNTYL